MQFQVNDSVVAVNIPTMAALRAAVGARLAARQGFALATINLDHLTLLPGSAAFRTAYAAQDFVVADGRPVGWLAALAGRPVDILPGSDLIVPLCEMAVRAGVSVALLGSNTATLQTAATGLQERIAGLQIAAQIAPPQGFEPMGDDAAILLGHVAASGAGLCFVALGAPKQEILAARGRLLTPAVGFVSIGAGLDFIAGTQVRAPVWMRRMALEWLWRTVQQPRRMIPRYARCFAALPGLAWRAWASR